MKPSDGFLDAEPESSLYLDTQPRFCSSFRSNQPFKCPYSPYGREQERDDYEHLTYLLGARQVEGLVARMGRGGSSPLQRIEPKPA